MRITNKVMQHNSIRNINRNKELQDTLTTQIATGKKISRPSEDPVIAIRALRLRSDVSQINQFYDKNSKDANQWMELTESAVKTTVEVIKKMITECEKGASDTLNVSDRKIIIDSLTSLGKEVYETGDADYAGRYVFTGYRTDTSLSFLEATTQTYNITELFRKEDLQQMTHVDVKNLNEISESNYTGAGAGEPALAEQDVTYCDYYRYRLSYDNIDGAKSVPDKISVTNKTGTKDYTVDVIDETAKSKEEVYRDAADPANAGKVYLIPSTGELVMGKDVYTEMMACDETTNFSINYSKTSWLKGDLRPQHYFYCTTKDPNDNSANPPDIVYNPQYLTKKSLDQKMEYQVGFNQSIQINTYPEEVFKHGIDRDVDEIIDLANRLEEAERVDAKLKSMKNDTANFTEAERKVIELDYDASQKSVSLLKDQLQKRFSNYITRMQDYLAAANNTYTEVGNRSARLKLISNRLEDQNTTFETLQSENEDVDLTEAAVRMSSAKVNYEAALMATGDIISTTLLNYL